MSAAADAPPPPYRCNESAGHGQMMDVETTSYSDFINCDRTGRRNAVPDISGEEKSVPSTSELSKDMAEMDLKAGGQYRRGAAPGEPAFVQSRKWMCKCQNPFMQKHNPLSGQ